MSFWTGTHWEPEAPPPAPARPSKRRHVLEAITEGALLSLIVVALISSVAFAGRKGTIQVTFGDTTTSTTARVSSEDGSIFTSFGCGFRAGSGDYYMVVKGPAPDTESLAYWVDPFSVGGDGCGQATVSWLSSGVPGSFDVYVVRSASGNPWQAQPASNIVTIKIVNP